MKGESSRKRRAGSPASGYVEACICGSKRIARAPAAFSVANQNVFGHQCQNIPQCCIRRTLRELSVFRSCKFSLEPIEKLIQNQTLPLIDCFPGDALPKVRLIEHGGEVVCAPSMARPKHSRNHFIHGVTSIVPFWVSSRMS